MKKQVDNLDYLDPDVAYLLGMILARGEFHVDGDIRRLVITFPYRSTTVAGSTEKQDRETAIRLGLDEIRDRVQELLETTVQVDRGDHEVTLRVVFPRHTIGWRDLRYLTGNRANYTEFELLDFLYDVDRDIQVELLRGFADAASEPSPADRNQAGRHRVVLQVQFGNWRLPIQLCRLLQTRLGVPVSHILWGHPNLRAPDGGSGWTKETRIRIWVDDFRAIGYYFKYKQDVFEELVRENERPGGSTGKPCNPKAKRIERARRKPPHLDEADPRLPPVLCGHHFDGYFQICQAMGCRQGRKPPQLEIFDDDDIA